MFLKEIGIYLGFFLDGLLLGLLSTHQTIQDVKLEQLKKDLANWEELAQTIKDQK